MSLSMIVTIATVAVIAFLVVFFIIGCCRGFLRIVLGAFSLVITLVLAGTFAPKLADYAENGTVIGPRVQIQIESFVDSKLAGLSGTATEAQNRFINSLPLTESMKRDLASKNTVANYVDQGVENFSQYISANLTTLILRILSYVILFVLILLVIRLILRMCNIINHIPVLGKINRFLGGVLGLAEGVIFLWILCLIVMMLSGTDLGNKCQQVIAESQILTYVYEHNYLMDLVNAILSIFRK